METREGYFFPFFFPFFAVFFAAFFFFAMQITSF